MLHDETISLHASPTPSELRASTPPREAPWQDRLMHRFYTRYPAWRGGQEEFHDLILRQVRRKAVILELGAGPSNPMSAFLFEHFRAVDGLDVGRAIRGNRFLRRAFIYRGTHFPVPDESYDAIVSNFVLEHVEQPEAVCGEIARVLKPGGVFIFRTPNRRHYVAGVSKLTPHWFHEKVANRLRNLSAGADDPYPTFYRLNSLGDLRRRFGQAGLVEAEIHAIEKEPSYGMAHAGLFLAMMLYERLVNSDALFAPFRICLTGAFRKPRRQRGGTK